METRYSFGGDDHVFVEVDEEMSLDAFFKSLSMTNAVRESRIKADRFVAIGNTLIEPAEFAVGVTAAGVG